MLITLPKGRYYVGHLDKIMSMSDISSLIKDIKEFKYNRTKEFNYFLLEKEDVYTIILNLESRIKGVEKIIETHNFKKSIRILYNKKNLYIDNIKIV